MLTLFLGWLLASLLIKKTKVTIKKLLIHFYRLFVFSTFSVWFHQHRRVFMLKMQRKHLMDYWNKPFMIISKI